MPGRLPSHEMYIYHIRIYNLYIYTYISYHNLYSIMCNIHIICKICIYIYIYIYIYMYVCVIILLDSLRCQLPQVVPFASAFRPVLPTRRDNNTNISRSSLPSNSPTSAFHPVGSNPSRPGPNPGGNVSLQSQPSGSGVLPEQSQSVSESGDSPAAAAAAARGQMQQQPHQQQAQAAS